MTENEKCKYYTTEKQNYPECCGNGHYLCRSCENLDKENTEMEPYLFERKNNKEEVNA